MSTEETAVRPDQILKIGSTFLFPYRRSGGALNKNFQKSAHHGFPLKRNVKDHCQTFGLALLP